MYIFTYQRLYGKSFSKQNDYNKLRNFPSVSDSEYVKVQSTVLTKKNNKYLRNTRRGLMKRQQVV